MKVYIPINQFRTNSVIQYHQPLTPPRREEYSNYHDLTKEKTYSGTVTNGAKKRIQKAVSILVQGSEEKWIQNPVTGKRQKFKISFITLTISSTEQLLTAKEAHKQLLEPFLRYARNKWGMKSYIWKAELQNRGQVHYHLTTNVFIEYYLIRDYWNKLQQKAGLLDEFKSKYGHSNPNSIDVHSVYKVKNLEAYLIKYLSKVEADKGKTEGKVWDCSINLKKAEYFRLESDMPSQEKLREVQAAGKLVVKECDRCKILMFRDCSIADVITPYALKKYVEWRQSLAL